MKTAATNKRVRELITGLQAKTIIPRPEFQRRLVWSNKDKVNFIDTVVSGYPFPEIYLADGDVDLDTGQGTQVLVDGQQRITTLFEYFTDSPELRLPRTMAKYRALDEGKKTEFLNYQVAVRDLGTVSAAEIIEVFRRINLTGYSLNEMEINNAVYKGPFKVFAEDIAELPFFDEHRFFRPSQVKRMGDVKFILSLLITMMHGYFNRDDEIEDYLTRFNEEFAAKDEMETRVTSVISLINDLRFDTDDRAWKQNDFFTLFIELDRAVNREKLSIDVPRLREALRDFYSKIDAEQEQSEDQNVLTYYTAVLQAANDRGSRVRRGDIVRQIIAGALQAA